MENSNLGPLLEALKSAGLSPGQLAAIKAALTSKAEVSTSACPACGMKPQTFDYVCGACSAVKARSPRTFWRYVAEREKGGMGRPVRGG